MTRSVLSVKTAGMAVTKIGKRTVMAIVRRHVAVIDVKDAAVVAIENEAVHLETVMNVVTGPASVSRLVATAISSHCVEEKGIITENNRSNIRKHIL